MSRRENIIISLCLALFVVAIDILWRKFGGLRSGGLYSTSHSWSELEALLPEFLFYFAITFIFMFVLNSLRKKAEYLICPKCSDVLEATDNIEKSCAKCMVPYENLKGFYERHPEKK